MSGLRGVEGVLQVSNVQLSTSQVVQVVYKNVVVIVEQPYKYTVLSTGASLSVVVVVVR